MKSSLHFLYEDTPGTTPGERGHFYSFHVRDQLVDITEWNGGDYVRYVEQVGRMEARAFAAKLRLENPGHWEVWETIHKDVTAEIIPARFRTNLAKVRTSE